MDFCKYHPISLLNNLIEQLLALPDGGGCACNSRTLCVSHVVSYEQLKASYCRQKMAIEDAQVLVLV